MKSIRRQTLSAIALVAAMVFTATDAGAALSEALAKAHDPLPSWNAGKATSFAVSIQVEALDRRKLLQDITTVLGEQHVNIISSSSNTGRDRIANLRFTFELADIAHLSSVLAAVKRVDSVFDAYRVLPG